MAKKQSVGKRGGDGDPLTSLRAFNIVHCPSSARGCKACRVVGKPDLKAIRAARAGHPPVSTETASKWLKSERGIEISPPTLNGHFQRDKCLEYENSPDT